MNSDQFNTYAKFYDLLYKDKDYFGEASYINTLITKHSSKSKQDIKLLDLACGTGKHLFELFKQGYPHLSGSDISESMIQVASENAARLKNGIQFYNYSFQQSNKILPQEFDVVISMFSAVNYITSYAEQLQALRNIHDLLVDDGLFIFDYWNGNAVVRDYSPVKVLRKKSDNSEIIRISRTTIDMINQHATVVFNCLYMEDGQKVNEFEEIHLLHYYFFQEMQNLLETAGFRILHRCPFMNFENKVDNYDWNISIIAQKINKK